MIVKRRCRAMHTRYKQHKIYFGQLVAFYFVIFGRTLTITPMKKILFILLLIPFLSSAQSQSEPFKFANTIIIQTQDSSHIALKKIAMILQESGYTISKLDKELQSLSTSMKPQTPNYYDLAVSCYAKGSNNAVIYLSGNYSLQVNYTGAIVSDMVVFKGPSFGADKLAFKEMQKVANSYPNATLKYEKR
jgi:hypothetical protein